jgi:hypothetical protein
MEICSVRLTSLPCCRCISAARPRDVLACDHRQEVAKESVSLDVKRAFPFRVYGRRRPGRTAPSTAVPCVLLTRKGSQVQTLSRPPSTSTAQAGSEDPASCVWGSPPSPGSKRAATTARQTPAAATEPSLAWLSRSTPKPPTQGSAASWEAGPALTPPPRGAIPGASKVIHIGISAWDFGLGSQDPGRVPVPV